MEDIMLKTYSNHFGGFLLYLTCVHQNRVCSNKQHILELLIFATCFVWVLFILYIYYVIIIRKQLLNNFVSLSFFGQRCKTKVNYLKFKNIPTCYIDIWKTPCNFNCCHNICAKDIKPRKLVKQYPRQKNILYFRK